MRKLLRLISAGVVAVTAYSATGVTAQEALSGPAQDPGGAAARDSCEPPQLLELGFAGGADVRMDDASDFYASPHWVVGLRSYPYLMQVGKTLIIANAKIQIPCSTRLRPLVKGVQDEGFNVPPTPVSKVGGGAYEIRDVSVTRAFGKAIAFSDAFKIDWQVSLDGGLTWDDAGASTNPIYVCVGPPSHEFRTIVHLACGSGGPLGGV